MTAEASPFDPGEFCDRQQWTFAKTQPKNPHWYLVENRLDPDDVPGYWALVSLIQTEGVWRRWRNGQFQYLRVGEYEYWGGPEQWPWINRRAAVD